MEIKLKVQTTRRKFYGKWLYRVGLTVPGISILRQYSPDEVIVVLTSSNKFIHPKTRANSEDITLVCQFLNALTPDAWTKRIENNHLDIYTNDKDIYQKCQTELSTALSSLSEPDPNSLEIIEKSNQIAVKKYPHNKYQYKVYLQPHKLKGDKSAKLDFVTWVDSQDRILISDAVKSWFLRTDWNWDRRYVMVEDPHSLLLLKMRGSELIGKVHEYVLVDK